MFDRVEVLIETDKLKDKTVLILGLGGVGSFTAITLARLPIKKLILVDSDKVEITNLNRQIYYNYDIGKNKVDALEEHIKNINPDIIVEKINLFIDENNIDILFKADYIVDACDTMNTKKMLIKKCLEKKQKFISCMGTANRLDATKFEIMDIRKTINDPVAKILRKYVKDERLKGKIPVVVSKELPFKSKKLGSVSFVPPVAGIYMTNYIINDILGE